MTEKIVIDRRAALSLLVFGLTQPQLALARPRSWAEPVVLAGVPNLHRMTPLLFRSAQPDAGGFTRLAAIGVRTVVSLRQTVDDAQLAAGSGLVTRRVPMKSRHVGDEDGDKVIQVLKLVISAQSVGPVLVHCHHGADRTGTVAAVYRMALQGWSHEEALDELINGGFGFHKLWRNIPRYLASVDINSIRSRLGG